MTRSLTERLKDRLDSQTAEIEALTSSELKKLAASLKTASEAELRSTHSAIREAHERMRSDLLVLKRFGSWWWGALIVTWLAILGLLALLLRASPPETVGIELYQTFSYEGRTYLLLPEGTEAMVCLQGELRVPCVALPQEN